MARPRFLPFATISTLFAFGCGDPVSAPSVDAEPKETTSTISCEPWHREPVPGKPQVLVNNVWNEQWADGQPYSQCLLERSTPSGVEYGWSWAWPEYKPYSSYAAPEVLFGWKAWDGGASTSVDLPRRIDSIESMNVDFSVEIAADPTYNLNTTLWVTATGEVTQGPNPDDIRNEIMVWFKNPADLGGGITYDGDVTLGGFEFEVWHLVNQPDASGGTTHTWTMVIYAAKTDHDQVTFDLKLMLDDAVAKGLVDPTHTVGGVELITEIFGGSGELWLDHFDVDVRGG